MPPQTLPSPSLVFFLTAVRGHFIDDDDDDVDDDDSGVEKRNEPPHLTALKVANDLSST